MTLRWTPPLRGRLLPRRREDPETSRVHEPGLLAELDELLAPQVEPWPSRRRAEAEWLEIRRLLATATKSTYEAARAHVAPKLVDRPLRLRVLVAQAFTADGECASAVIDECLRQPICPAEAALLLGVSPDLARNRSLLAALCPPPLERLVELVETFGAEAVPLLGMVHDRLLGTSKKPKVTDLRPVLTALSVVPCEESGRRLSMHLGSTSVRKLAASFYREVPDVALAVLPEAARGRSKAARAAQTLLEHARVDAGASDDAPSPSTPVDAPKAAWPAILQKPRWRGKKGRTIPQHDGVVAPEGELRVPAELRDVWERKLPMIPSRRLFTPQAGLAIAHARASAEHRAACDEWIDTFAELAAIGLVPAALREPSVARTEAGRVLRRLARERPDALQSALARYPEPVRALVGAVIDLDPLEDCPVRAPKLPAFVSLEALPAPLLRSGGALPVEARKAICEMLAFADLGAPYAGLAQVADACTAESLDAFSAALFRAWRDGGASGKSAWPLIGVATLGGSAAAAELAAWVRERDGANATATVELALHALSRMGTASALSRLHALAEGARHEGVRTAARAELSAVAAERGLDVDALADRIVPDFGLAGDEPLTLSYGPREFIVSFDDRLAPRVYADGVALAALPTPNAADDATLAARARARFAALREEGAAVLLGQSRRLERAMLEGRRWSRSDFETYLVGNPLLCVLVQRLVWAAHDGDRRRLFRVAEDRTLADADDEPLTLGDRETVGLPHPLDLAPEARAHWGSLLADYEIIQPFEQLGREVHRRTTAEARSQVLDRFRKRTIDIGGLFALESCGFRRERGGWVTLYERPVTDGLRVQIQLAPGFDVRDMGNAPAQTVYVAMAAGKTFGDLGPIAFSEIIRDIERYTS